MELEAKNATGKLNKGMAGKDLGKILLVRKCPCDRDRNQVFMDCV
jgi:hypothetical protein